MAETWNEFNKTLIIIVNVKYQTVKQYKEK